LGNPVERVVSNTLPGAIAHLVFPVSGIHTVVERALRLRASP
jgi:hypothetical protein